MAPIPLDLIALVRERCPEIGPVRAAAVLAESEAFARMDLLEAQAEAARGKMHALEAEAQAAVAAATAAAESYARARASAATAADVAAFATQALARVSFWD